MSELNVEIMQTVDQATTLKRLQTWLAEQIPGASELTVKPVNVQLGAGASAEIFFIAVEYKTAEGLVSKELVVRRQAETYKLILGNDLILQSRMMAAMNQHSDVPVPLVIGMEVDDVLLGAPFMVMSRIKGEIAKMSPNYNVEGWLTEFTPQQRLQTWTQAIEAFASVHRLDWRDGFSFLDNSHRGEPGLDQYLHWLEEWYRWAANGRAQPIADKGLEYLLHNRPHNAACNLLWGDPHPSNVMFNPDGSIAALIDWEMAALGPGELDLAWWLYFDELFSTHFGVKRLEGLPDRAATIAIYEKAMGRPVENMAYYDIIVALKMTIITLRTADRHIGLGNIRPDNKSVFYNFQTQHLAKLLGLEFPELGPEFYQFMEFALPKSK